MGGNQFRFKQFTILQDRCAMKVGTDGTLLGTWVDISGVEKILDIGTGTGLIALMLAQRCGTRSPADIDAVEIDINSSIQARENVERSPWSNKVKIVNYSIQEYTNFCQKRYDLIVSNPPFFENASKAANKARTVARHTDFLSQDDLLQTAVKLLSKTGKLAVIYPVEQAQKFLELAEDFGLFCQRKLYVKPMPEIPTKRILMELGKNKLPLQEKTLTIEAKQHIYTPEFITLIKDFYLKY
ncbi:MAG: methyltransferase [Okeania sp. SIO3I5]|uniref:tRNA1(Val) (adenine(37)-N6)-methyltransferase n=1 Tax=Okeania sp. SIO3I5 TaxID=2607805 RepID=UPI0013BCE157|nr:methyltransferase [Okeania sp. SIO3I5]NEQ41757.1 methyltransferase [Okeania sp. SIO3I5]